jgi:glycosyltransferase involved in cell wall biosynthesis
MPAVSVILPTYNRARFLPEAFESICGQTFTDWELIVVDDGGTDDTSELVVELSKSIPQPVRYIYQENLGAYSARNTGLDHATGRYLAFFDSDDLWLPHHLQDCAAALERNPHVDWVYGACRVVDFASGRVVAPSTFYVDGGPRPFLKLRTRRVGDLRIIDDPAVVRCMISDGLFCGLQNSTFRDTVFENRRLPPFRIGEDRVFPITALNQGLRIGYIDNVHVVYHVHAENTSQSARGSNVDRQVWVQRELIRALESIRPLVQHDRGARAALKKRLSEVYFWNLGYATLWQNGRRGDALRMFRRGLEQWPWDLRYWKTGLASLVRFAWKHD